LIEPQDLVFHWKDETFGLDPCASRFERSLNISLKRSSSSST